MKKNFLLTPAFNGLFKKAHKTLLVFALVLTISFNSFAHRVETYQTTGCFNNQNVTVDAVIVSAGAATRYQWQFRDASGNWRCFVNGTNATTINGIAFTISGATGGPVANDAPLLTISRTGGVMTVLENVEVRVLMRDNALPVCTSATSAGHTLTGDTYGGDDVGLTETKYLRLHIYSVATDCGGNTPGCLLNVLVNAGVYYGGFEGKVYNSGTDTYTDNNFGSNASSAFTVVPETTPWTGSAGSQAGVASRYQVLDNPYFMNTAFIRNLAPHTGNFQMVVQGSTATTGNSARAWFKSVSVSANTAYTFSVWAARLDGTDPIINLNIDGVSIKAVDMSVQTIGNWFQISGQYNRGATNGTVVISISDTRTGGANHYTLDDICFRQCTNCSTLPLHNLDLSASLQGSSVGLKWTAENEMNTNLFIIERSTDGINFSQIGTKAASGQTNTITNYESSDNIQTMMSTAIIYYRIKATDIDNRYAFSNVVAVRLSKTAGVQIWPSPFGDNVNITYNADANTKIDVSILNSIGKIVNQSSYNVSHGLNQISVTNLGTLSSGIYFIRITDKNTNESYIQKLTK